MNFFFDFKQIEDPFNLLTQHYFCLFHRTVLKISQGKIIILIDFPANSSNK